MATLEQIAEALRRADAAGNVEDARALAEAYKAKQAETSPGPRASDVDMTAGQTPGAFGNNPMAVDMPPSAEEQPASFDDYVRSFGANVESIPVAGPPVYNWMRETRAKVQGMTPEEVDAETAGARQRAPGADVAGKFAYNIAPYAIAGAFAPTARLLGITGKTGIEAAPFLTKATDLAARSGAAFLSNEAIGTADSMVRGDDLGTAAQENLLPSAAVSALPLAGATLRGVGRAAPKVANWAAGGAPSLFWQMINKDRAAQNMLGRTMKADRGAGLALDATEDAAALARGQNLNNLDRGGPATRNLARVATAKSPEGRATLTGAIETPPPGPEVGEFLTKLVGGSADDLALREGLETTARKVNTPAYLKAESAPAAQSIWTPEIQQLMHSPEFLQAVRQAEGSGKTWAALHGGKPVQSPFVFAADGTVTMRPGVTPNLKFWDQVQRNLRKQAEKLGPKEKAAASELDGLRKQLLTVLDAAVPDFKKARLGAAGFFGAENAMDAGRAFALQPRNLPEATKAFNAMSDVDKKAFRIGAASSAVDKLKTGDSFAVVKQTFGSPAAKEFWRTVLGPAKAGELEAFVKIQALKDASKRAITGNSHTFDLLAGAGLAGGATAANWIAPGNSLSNVAYLLAAGRVGAHILGRTVEKDIMTKVAQLLASEDKAALNKIIANASLSPKWQAALDGLLAGTHSLARGGTVAAMTAAPAMATPQTDTRDYSRGLPPPLSQGPRASVPVP